MAEAGFGHPVDGGRRAVRRPRPPGRHTGGGSGSLVAVNGTILEQSQILTSHNLAVLIDAVGLRDPST